MNRRDFLRRIAGIAVVAAVAPVQALEQITVPLETAPLTEEEIRRIFFEAFRKYVQATIQRESPVTAMFRRFGDGTGFQAYEMAGKALIFPVNLSFNEE